MSLISNISVTSSMLTSVLMYQYHLWSRLAASDMLAAS